MSMDITSPSGAARTAGERVAKWLQSGDDIAQDALHTVTGTEPGIRLLKDDLAELIEDSDVASGLYASPVPPTADTLAAQLHAQLAGVLASAEIAERDGETMRQAIRKAFDVFDEAKISQAQLDREDIHSSTRRVEIERHIWKGAAEAMSSALGGLLRVHIESHEL